MTGRRRTLVRVEDLLGCRVRATDGTVVGRIEEIRARRRNDVHEVTEYRLGTGAMLERFAVVRRIFGRKPKTLVARWDQLDIRRADRPLLACGVDQLERVDQ